MANNNPPLDEFGWVIEHADSPGFRPKYLSLEQDALANHGQEAGWTEDHLKALRFARKQDAHNYATFYLTRVHRIAEHGWSKP